MMPYRLWRRLAEFSLILSLLQGPVQAQSPTPALAPLGTPPSAAAAPHLEFAFEFRVTLAPVVIVGQTALGHRQYIGITGGSIAGPKLTGEPRAFFRPRFEAPQGPHEWMTHATFVATLELEPPAAPAGAAANPPAPMAIRLKFYQVK